MIFFFFVIALFTKCLSLFLYVIIYISLFDFLFMLFEIDEFILNKVYLNKKQIPFFKSESNDDDV